MSCSSNETHQTDHAAHDGAHGDHHQHGHHGPGKHGNPEDLEAYINKMIDPERDAWQKPQAVLDALNIGAGQAVCDIGVGPGYWAFPIAKRVGDTGQVWAVDVEATMLADLQQRIAEASTTNIIPVLAQPADPLLPLASCDVILVVNTYHHFPDGPTYLKRLAQSLKPGGRIVNIDFHKREMPVGPPVDHKIAHEDFIADVDKAGLKVAADHDLLEHQYFVEITAP